MFDEATSSLYEKNEKKIIKSIQNLKGDKTMICISHKLSNSNYLAGKNYSIADIATFPWIARHTWHDIGLKNFKSLTKWYEKISERNAVIKGYDCLKKGEVIPKP